MFARYNTEIDKLIKSMSLREKIGQLNQIQARRLNTDKAAVIEQIRKGEVGSILIANSATAGNDKQGRIDVDFYNELQRVAVEQSPSKIPMIFGRDVIHGHRTVYPIPLAFSASFNPSLIEKCYRFTAKEAAADGIHWTFAPMLDLCRDARWGRIIEGMGEDPFLSAEIAKACVKGFQGNDISDKDSLVACAKHYIGYGASEGGRDYHRTEISDYSLFNYYMPAFRAAVESGVGTVMSAFNDINGVPVSGSKKYLTDILRSMLGFKGFVVSDWMAVQQLKKQGICETDAKASAIALKAGVDMDMVDDCYISTLEKLVNDGKLEESYIDLAVRRVLSIKFAKGLFERPYCEKRTVNRTEHLKSARELACESMVLLKNENVLPLKKDMQVLLAGPFVNEKRALLGSWTLDGRAEETPSIKEAMQNKIGCAKVFCDDDTNRIFDNFNRYAQNSDVIVLALGESHRVTGEAHSVADISLSCEQKDLIARAKRYNKKVVGVIFGGRPLAMDGVAEMLDAVLYAWHSGSECANAACDLLFGDAVPSGKTAVTFLRNVGQVPLYYNVTSSGRPVNGYYGERPEYVYTDTLGSPCYPFGHGLSYTEFEYKEIIADTVCLSLEQLKDGAKFNIEIDVENKGGYDAKETVFLFIRDKVASVMRPIRELKGFEKPFIKKGDVARVKFELGFDKLGFYNDKGEYVLERGEFEVYIGKDCLTQNKIIIKVI